MIELIRGCFISDKVLYSQHARVEMEQEEFGEIQEKKSLKLLPMEK